MNVGELKEALDAMQDDAVVKVVLNYGHDREREFSVDVVEPGMITDDDGDRVDGMVIQVYSS